MSSADGLLRPSKSFPLSILDSAALAVVKAIGTSSQAVMGVLLAVGYFKSHMKACNHGLSPKQLVLLANRRYPVSK